VGILLPDMDGAAGRPESRSHGVRWEAFLCPMCYNTTLDRDVRTLEKRMHKRMLEEGRRVGDPDPPELPLDRTTAFARPLWPVVSSRSPDRISVQRWGLLPRYIRTDEEAREFLKRTPTFNAISEEVAAKRTFKRAFEAGQRCLVPVTAFQEWRHEGKEKIPYRITMKDGDVFCLGGLWEEHTDGDTYTVLTTRANPLMEFVHNTRKRMPVIIAEEHWGTWLLPGLPASEVLGMCAPYPEELMLAEPVGQRPVQASLF
ncbi:MAG TPA: SOS response-associated peptidase, partial [Flavobacteriales bacterium]|nr:SOS response-associated peptidase [Flavobacteriales bacterium]